jgi:cyclase
VADLFARSDAGPLPAMVGVSHRSLLRFGSDLYFHYIEADDDVNPALDEVRSHPHYRELNDSLGRFITAYDPETWRSPRDAMAETFYEWDRGPRRTTETRT